METMNLVAKGKGQISLSSELVCDNAYWVEGLKHDILSDAHPNGHIHYNKLLDRAANYHPELS